MNSAEPRIGFIGIGALGSGLAMALAQQGYPVTAVHSRRSHSAIQLAGRLAVCQAVMSPQAVADAVDIVFITTPDSAIAAVATAIKWRPGQGVVHCCGAAGLDLLAVATAQGATAGAFHPFQTFAALSDPAAALARLSGVVFAVSAAGWLQEYLDNLARQLGGRPVQIADADRPLYHAAAVLGCGYLATVLQAAVALWQAAGFSPEQAIDALLPLSRATLENLATLGLPAALTGPAVRGDAATVQDHLQAIADRRPELTDLYLTLTATSLNLAAAGENSQPSENIRSLLRQYDGRLNPCPE